MPKENTGKLEGDFSLENIDVPLPGSQAPQEGKPQTTAKAPQREQKPVVKPKSLDDLALEDNNIPVPDININNTPKEGEGESLDVQKSTKQENLGVLRRQLKEKEEEISKLEGELSSKGALELSAKEYADKVKELEEKTGNYEKEIEDLRQYRDALDIAKNPVYRDKFVIPIEREQTVILNTAKQYGVTEKDLQIALAQNNLSGFENVLQQLGVGATGIMQLVGSLRKIHEIKQEEAVFSKDKKNFLRTLKEEQERNDTLSTARVSEVLKSTSGVVWKGAVDSFREDAVKNAYPTAQVTQNDNWNNVLKQADQLGRKVFDETLVDLESNIKHKTVTPQLVNKIAKLSFGYSQFVKDQKVYNVLAKRVKDLEEELSIVRGDTPSLGGGTTYSNSANTAKKPSYKKTLDEIADEL